MKPWPRHLRILLASGSLLVLLPAVHGWAQLYGQPAATPVVVTAACDIKGAVDRYRSLLGPDNGGAPGHRPSGRREINWDGVPDEVSAPQFLPPDFFNAAAAPRARGAAFTTPGKGVQVSAKGTGARFGHINPGYTKIFKTFSPERLFSPIGSNIVDMTFFVPGTKTPAVTRGFGAVYADVDEPHTAFEYFDQGGRALGRFSVPACNNGLSFLGVVFDRPVVARVRIVYGTAALGPNDAKGTDVAVMDDFIYGEPQPADASAPGTGYTR